MLSSISVVLRDPPPDGELISRMHKAMRALDGTDLDVFLVYEEALVRAPGVVVHVWWDAMLPDFDVRLVLDDVLRTRYISVCGLEPPRRRRVLEAIAAQFDVVPLNELRDAAKGSAEERAWVRLALGIVDDFDPPTFDRIREALKSGDAGQRGGAAQAAAMLQWPALADALKAALARETDPAILRTLQIAARETAQPS